jgi:hypothetical protein
MTLLYDGLAKQDAGIILHVPDDRLINTMISEALSITMFSPEIILQTFWGSDGNA